MLHDYEPDMLEAFAERAPKWKTLQTLVDENNHEVAYVEFTMNAPRGSQKRQIAVICDCNFKPNLGWHVGDSGRAVFWSGGIRDPENCFDRQRILGQQKAKLQIEFQQRCTKLLPSPNVDESIYRRIRMGLLWLAELLRQGELIDPLPHSFLPYPHFSLRSAAEILNESNVQRVKLVAELLADTGKLNMRDNHIFVVP